VNATARQIRKEQVAALYRGDFEAHKKNIKLQSAKETAKSKKDKERLRRALADQTL